MMHGTLRSIVMIRRVIAHVIRAQLRMRPLQAGRP